MPKLSIITINYNNLEGLKRTVESVVNQTWKEFEYIVIDGGSTDGSAAYIESQSDSFDYWVSEKDSGIYNAMNKGIRAANGEYLLFLNSGDHLFNNEVLEFNHHYLENEDLIYFNLEIIGIGTSNIISYPNQLIFSDLYFGSLPHPATFIKKELFNKVGLYDEELLIASDWKFFILALFKHNASYKYIDGTCSTFYLDGISSKQDFSEERREVLELFFSDYIIDYQELYENRQELKVARDYLNTNRSKMLAEIEKITFGRKMISIIFRIIITIFSKNSVSEVLK
jgi:glycosyltransferase involved in cell wall biosynthesis